MPKLFFLTVLWGSAILSPLPDVVWAADEVQDALTGTNVGREHTETNSLFNTLRDVYRPRSNKPSQAPLQAPYQRVAPPKWSYYGTRPKEEKGSPKKTPAVDGHYYKPKAEPKKEK